jgi:hypothetical protein
LAATAGRDPGFVWINCPDDSGRYLESSSAQSLLGGTAVFLLCAFGFAALIVRSYNRDKQKLIEQNRYNDDRIVK